MIYESSTIRVEDCTIDGDRTNVVVTFPFARGKDGFRDPFGKEFFARRAISAIHITISTSNWFQSEELNAALSAVRTRTAQFDRVVTYGQSMGGYGAIAASAAVGAHAILAMAPQFSLDRAKVPWEKRWPVQHTAIVDGGGYVRDELEELIAPEAELYLVYDPRTVDSRHVDLIIPISRNAIPIPIPFAGHKIAQFLLDAKLLSELVESIVRGMPFDGKAWRKRFRAVRSGLGHWWMEVSDGARRRTALTVLAARRALAIEPQGRRQQVVMAKALISNNQYEEAVIFLSDVVATFPKDGPLRMMLGYALLRAGRPEKALQEFETVALLMPASGDVITMMERARDVIAKKDQPIGKDVMYDAMAAKATPSIDAGRFENIPTASDVVLGPLLPGSSKFGESCNSQAPHREQERRSWRYGGASVIRIKRG